MGRAASSRSPMRWGGRPAWYRTNSIARPQSTTQSVDDAGDRRTQIIDSVASTITRGYDLLDRMTSETTPEGSISYTYDADGRRASMIVAGQAAVSYGYDNAHRLTSITQGTTVVSLAYDDANR